MCAVLVGRQDEDSQNPALKTMEPKYIARAAARPIGARGTLAVISIIKYVDLTVAKVQEEGEEIEELFHRGLTVL
jgi:hypothetical protein